MNVFELFASLFLDDKEYRDKLDEAEGTAEKKGSSIGSKLATAGKVAGAALTVAAGAVSAIGGQAVKAYASFEQLAGGVETLFGEISSTVDASATVMQNASNAYKTAGISANQYMETVTSFSASLMASLGNDAEAAASAADMAIIDMADNANKMGTSMESIQNAYQGFAKQNYTMLDNLKLGYGGTKEEMERLLADAEKVSGVHYDISNLNDVYQAIHVVQGELGITGTTAKEALTTIEGSLNSTKAAWENLLVGIADEDADFESLVNNFVDSAGAAAGNLLPRFEVALGGIGRLIEGLAPVLADKLPGLIENLLPKLIDAAKALLDGLVKAAPDILKTLVGVLPQVVQAGVDLIVALVQGLTEALPELIPVIVDAVILIVETLIDNIDLLLDAAGQLIIALSVGLLMATPKLLDAVPVIVGKLVNAFVEFGKDLIKPFADIGKHMIDGLWDGIKSKFESLKKNIKGLVDGIKSIFTGKDGLDIHSPSRWGKGIGKYLMDGVETGLESNKNAVFSSINGIVDKMKNSFDVDAGISGFGNAYATERVATNSTYNFTFNSPKALTPAEANKEAKRAYRDMALAF